MAYHQAIREAYPGATYLHMGQAYRVNRWTQGFNKLAIHVTGTRKAAATRPILRKSVTIDLSRQGIIPGRIRKGTRGLLAEAQVQINESVEGYVIGNTQFRYREERAKNPNMRRKQRDFRTTGVVVKIEEEWFSNSSVRREVAEGLRDLLARDRSIAPQDIDSAHTNIALLTEAGLRPMTDIVVIYDSVYGSLRLTESLFDEFGRFIERLVLGTRLSQGDGIVSADTADLMDSWSRGLSVDSIDAYGDDAPQIDVPVGWLRVFKPGSVVGIYSQSELHDRELVEPRYIDDPFNPGSQVLYYSYKDDRNRNGVSYTPADGVVRSGHDWDWVLWNPDTGEYREMEAFE